MRSQKKICPWHQNHSHFGILTVQACNTENIYQVSIEPSGIHFSLNTIGNSMYWQQNPGDTYHTGVQLYHTESKCESEQQ